MIEEEDVVPFASEGPPSGWPRVEFLAWSTCACPTNFGYDPPGSKCKPGWWVSLCVQSYFADVKVCEVAAGGEGTSLDDAERQAEEMALGMLRRMDARPLSVEQLGIRALALRQLARRIDGAVDGSELW